MVLSTPLFVTQVAAAIRMRNIPRFGHSSDFANLWGSKEEKSDYIWGLLFAGLLLLSFFITWTCVLVVFKWMGRRKVGFLSGAPFFKCIDSDGCSDRPSICRLIFVNASFLYIVFSVLFVTQGLANLRTTVNTFHDSANVSLSYRETNGSFIQVSHCQT